MRAPTTLGLSGTRGRVPSPGRFPRDRRPCGEGPRPAFFASSTSSPVLFTQEVSVSLPNNSSPNPVYLDRLLTSTVSIVGDREKWSRKCRVSFRKTDLCA